MTTNLTDKEEKKYLLGDMIVPENRGSTSIFDQLEHLKHMLIDMPTNWAVINISLKKTHTKYYASNYGIWSHGTKNTSAHNDLGMAFVGFMLNKKIFNKIQLSDSPDFFATSTINGKGKTFQINISGDVGRCTTLAIMQGLQRLENIHDLWISVLDWSNIIVIEFHYSPSIYYSYKLRTRSNSLKSLPFNLNNLTHKELAEIFYCYHCEGWTIEDNSLEELKHITWE